MTIDWLHVSVLLNILGIIWSCYRELLLHDLSKRLAWTGQQVIEVVRGASTVLERLSANVENNKGDRSELMAMLKAIEDRLGALIRDCRGPASGVVPIVQNFNVDNSDDSASFTINGAEQANITTGSGTQNNQRGTGQ